MSLLDRNIIVRFGEEQMTLRDVIARAAQQDGMTHVVYEPSDAPRLPTAKVVDKSGYEEVLGKICGCQDFRQAIDVKTGAQEEIFYVVKRRRETAATKLEA